MPRRALLKRLQQSKKMRFAKRIAVVGLLVTASKPFYINEVLAFGKAKRSMPIGVRVMKIYFKYKKYRIFESIVLQNKIYRAKYRADLRVADTLIFYAQFSQGECT